MAKAEFITYTEKELAAIEMLKANKGSKLTAAELGIPTAVLTSIYNKGNDARPMAEGVERVVLNKEDVVKEVTVEKNFKAYWID